MMRPPQVKNPFDDYSFLGWWRWFGDHLPMFLCGAMYVLCFSVTAIVMDWRFAMVYLTYLIWWGIWCMERRRFEYVEVVLMALVQARVTEIEEAMRETPRRP